MCTELPIYRIIVVDRCSMNLGLHSLPPIAAYMILAE
jgi:hypothetical protein